jgi:type VI secretion system secreted protein VgrG
MPKTDFVEKHQKTFSALGSGDPAYAAQGVYVQFINSDEGSTPVWVRLSDSMMTIPERGTFVMVSRARDETEIPEVSQVLDSVGSRTVMPKKYSKNTSWGDSYSTSYGDSFHVSVPNVPKTEYDTFTELVKGQQDTDQFNDVSFSESASSNYSVAESSRSVSVMGASPPDDIKVQDAVTPSVDEYVQVSRSVTYGDTFSSNEQQGNTTSVSKTLGNSESTTTTVGNTHSESTTEGNSSSNSKTLGNTESYTEQVGTQHSESTILGATFSKTDQQGDAVTVTTNTTTESVVATASSVSTSTIGDSVSNNNVEVSYSANITDISVSENVTGLSDNTNTTMLNISDNSTDLTVSQDVTLQSVTSSFTGDSVSETVGLTSTTFNNVADSQEFNMTPSGYKATVKADQPETSIQGMQVNIVVEMHITL